jgi:hypothetical protein
MLFALFFVDLSDDFDGLLSVLYLSIFYLGVAYEVLLYFSIYSWFLETMGVLDEKLLSVGWIKL